MRRELTNDQAELLRKLRKTSTTLENLSEEMSTWLCTACECDMTPDKCYVCAVLSVVYDLQEVAGRLGIRIDSALEGKEFPDWSEPKGGPR